MLEEFIQHRWHGENTQWPGILGRYRPPNAFIGYVESHGQE